VGDFLRAVLEGGLVVSDHDPVERGDVLRLVSHTKYGPLHVGCADTCRACCIEALPPSPVALALEAVAEAARARTARPHDLLRRLLDWHAGDGPDDQAQTKALWDEVEAQLETP